MSPRIERTLRKVVELLVRKDYPALEQLTRGGRLNAAEIGSGVDDYGRTLVLPPPEAFSRVDVVPVRGTTPPAYSIRFRLFTREEGESDLEVQATFIDNPASDLMTVELDNILVA